MNLYMLARLLICLACCLLLGCGPGTGPQAAVAELSGITSGPLPPLPVDRLPGEAVDSVVNGSQFHLKSTNASPAGSELELFSTLQDPSWAIYQLPSGGEPLIEVQLLLDIPAGSLAQVALADYGSGRWEFSDPAGASVTLPLSDPDSISPLGNAYLAVLATAGEHLNVVRLVLARDLSGWQFTTIEEQNVGGACSLAEVSGAPAVTYDYVTTIPGQPDQLRYALAQNSPGITADDWSSAVVFDGMPSANFMRSSLAVIDGKPAVAFYEGMAMDLLYIRSSSADGAADADWSGAVIVDSSGDTGDSPCLAVIAGNPAISFEGSGKTLRYSRSATADGESAADWSSTSLELDGGNIQFSTPNPLLVADGRPGILFSRPGGELLYRLSNSVDGADLADWAAAVEIADDLLFGGKQYALIADGNPAVAYKNSLGGLSYLRSTSVSGSAPGDWSQSLELEGELAVQDILAIFIDAGRPAVVCMAGGKLTYFRATNASGIGGPLGWLQTEILDLQGDGVLCISAASVAGRPTVCFIRVDVDGDGAHSLEYAVLLD
ncbi:hypothetical protein KDL44_03895 [bacterium]|nr:hypothetical protein [bacterium]